MASAEPERWTGGYDPVDFDKDYSSRKSTGADHYTSKVCARTLVVVGLALIGLLSWQTRRDETLNLCWQCDVEQTIFIISSVQRKHAAADPATQMRIAKREHQRREEEERQRLRSSGTLPPSHRHMRKVSVSLLFAHLSGFQRSISLYVL